MHVLGIDAGDEARKMTPYELREEFIRNPVFRRRLPPKPYARVYEHIDRMVAAGCTQEQLDEAERHFRAALAIQPALAEAQDGLAAVSEALHLRLTQASRARLGESR